MIKMIHGRRFEDYLKTIFKISNEKEEVRLKDIVRELGVRPSTALQYILKLRDMGLVTYYQGKVRLTPKGEKIAEELFTKFIITKEFFQRILGMDSEKAESVSCLIEHVLDEETIQRMKRVLETWERCNYLDSFEATNKQ